MALIGAWKCLIIGGGSNWIPFEYTWRIIMHFSIPLEQMSVEDKLQAIEEIWANLAGTPENIVPPSWHTDVLRGREERISEGRSHFLDIAEAKKAVKDQLK